MTTEQSNGQVTSWVIQAQNVHCDECGPPPGIVTGPKSKTYVGYFENPYGEQWVVEIDREKSKGTLRGGDTGWDRTYEIANDELDRDLILNAEEFHWLAACWVAATGRELKQPAAWEAITQLMGMTKEERQSFLKQYQGS